MAWTILLIAGLFEVVWALTLKTTQGWTKLWPSVASVAAMLVSFFLLSQAMKHLPVSTAYPVWVGIGAAGTAVLGTILFNEPVTAWRIGCIVLIVAGVLGLRLAG